MDSISVSQSSYSSSSSQQEAGYIPIRCLGRGAFGEAWLYRKTEDNSLVVWKMVNMARLDERRKREAQNEIDVLHMFEHPNIVAYYNHFLDDHTLLIEMEYANGGSMYHMLGQYTTLLEEADVIWYFFQLVSALQHIHDQGILHRDIKTLNIFMTKASLVKVGDFGISKVLGSKEMAETLQGTPYYMSPEIVQGMKYNHKSDIWALGCVLFEILTLKRMFDATNPLKLASAIVNADLQSIDSKYSKEMQEMVKWTLEKDPDKRPSADEIMDSDLLKDRNSLKTRVLELHNAGTSMRPSSGNADTIPVVTSKTTEVFYWGAGRQTPIKMEHFEKETSAIHVATSRYHMAVITIEREVYTWCNMQGSAKSCGQLGHGDVASYRAPKRVEALVGIAIENVQCGDDFTLFQTMDGYLYICGSSYSCCLGETEEERDSYDLLTPARLSFFTEKRLVKKMACGDQHVIVLTQNSEVYTWGIGEFGRLGLGNEDDYETPQYVKLPTKKTKIINAFASTNGSFLINENGKVLACGSNECNKLGFNSTATGLTDGDSKFTWDIPCVITFKIVKPLSRYHIVMISSGSYHSAAIDNWNQLFMFGTNRNGELGMNDYKERFGVHNVCQYMGGKRFIQVSCGEGFTVACTTDSLIYSWGKADNGRLGLGAENKPSKSQNLNFSVARPRPIFGALHLVVNISSNYWHTLMIAERVLEQRTVRSLSSKNLSRNSETIDDISEISDFQLASVSDQSGSPKPSSADTCASYNNQTQDTSDCPPWLKAELEGAEFIPLERENIPTKEDLPTDQKFDQEDGRAEATSNEEATTPRCECQCACHTSLIDKEEIIKQLQQEVKDLKDKLDKIHAK